MRYLHTFLAEIRVFPDKYHKLFFLQIQGEPDWKMPLQPGDMMGPPLPLPPVPPTLSLQVRWPVASHDVMIMRFVVLSGPCHQ